MTEATLTPDAILEAAEDVLRRFGPAKANVVDVARALGVSHGSVYRHFASKAALREAVTARWLERVAAPIALIAEEDGPAAGRLERWLVRLFETKRSRALDDPELFATYLDIAADAREAVEDHVRYLIAQVTRIVKDGMASGEFAIADPAATARAVFYATGRFHDPVCAKHWSSSTIESQFKEVWRLVLQGLRPR